MKLYPHDGQVLDRAQPASGIDPDYGPVFERIARRTLEREEALAREQAEAPRLAARLLAQPAPRRDLLLENSRRFSTWGLLHWRSRRLSLTEETFVTLCRNHSERFATEREVAA